ncbi:conserved hypothetical protein [Rhodospirillum rubrum ATCC 11170]|uniref:Uncharacterized protein n=2 Tax=Rhodospirillum rubrum TaxID=1085 RepID=Q2RPU8_RHORT|nr:conserved hypothetical protein [Rhodospirillum rubrum ATCC 11170]MBK5955524.1 hypothetical protein [Rhodospirillum rubrum]HAP98872.1 hypothetical protein [Rhodospirillum rubrum]HCF18222.1 hypothetical protein [Rhodospirillum rubrum]
MGYHTGTVLPVTFPPRQAKPMIAPFASRRVLSALAVLAVLAASGCSAFQKPEKRGCPEVRIDAATADLTRFRAGPGRDVTDITLTGEVAGFEGTCSYDKTGVTVEMFLSFALELGPAASGRAADFEYFVALPSFFPSPAAKKTYTASVVFPDNVNRVRFRDEKVVIRLPLKEDENAAGEQVYAGFQLTRDELRYNQEHNTGAR